VRVAVCIGACVVALIATAAADPATPSGDELRATGEKLAKDGRYSEAIAAFKAADKLTPRATNWCLIGLAYTRRELWPQAEISIDRCNQLASTADPLPSWMPALEKQLASRLAAVDVAAIDIAVEPAGVAAELAVSSFAPDETFHARVIHLPFGHHVISATAPGYARADVAIDVVDRAPQHVVVKLQPPEVARVEVAPATPATTPAPAPAPQRPVTGHRRLAPWIVMGAGVGVALAGAIVDATALATAANHLDDAHDNNDLGEYTTWDPRYDQRREIVIGLYAAGAVTAGVGLVMWLTGHRDDESGVQVSAAPTPGGSIVSVRWSR
jgi:hypothetical protein